uniref:Uncharacterized protein n=1 Tax=Chromera velia CCMP2878 TaxID=1169474 RepID=A0A0G4FEP6_9ALVE|eukprot:Cvel_3250.t1-p1 / transcript=Cvel_3250.t1 / gene=Cvel_3250 / organism=Chromera_velia_CCMP2878 / gene_product=hypothetical protein / transcript_product=hypothetical protein / location=Cvel_scaffold127:93146-93382(+) / protein_length=79 / sequence_SO=supercontig / SO=protein_coding / is_pseudo=false
MFLTRISAVLEDMDARGEQVDSDSDVGDREGSNDEEGSELSNEEEEESDEEEEEETPRHSYSTASRRSRCPTVSSDIAE